MKLLDAIFEYFHDRFDRSTPLSLEIIKLRNQLSGLVRATRQLPDARVSRLFEKNAAIRLNEASSLVAELQNSKLTFDSTETWRSVYEELLANVTCKRYLSVALIRSEAYWQDRPGQESLELNYRLLERGFDVHRVFIVDDFFWSPSSIRPSAQVYDWIFKQYLKNIDVGVLRMSDLENEADLVCDFGIYGDEAVGYQQTNFKGKTTRFEIDFGDAAVREAEARWKNLLLYATNFETILR